jgi:hypothetical protein
MLKEFKLMTLGGYIVIYDATGLSFFIARGTYRALVQLHYLVIQRANGSSVAPEMLDTQTFLNSGRTRKKSDTSMLEIGDEK